MDYWRMEMLVVMASSASVECLHCWEGVAARQVATQVDNNFS